MERIARWLPLIADLRKNGRRTLATDSLAGTLTAILLIPQALAYALLAGVPPEVGLYASIIPPIIYALLGSSRTLAVGPVAVAAVMVSAALTPFAAGDPARYLSGALMLSSMVGLLLLGLAALRLGWLTHFISEPVLKGFITGAAIFIIATQLAPLAGLSVARDAGFIDILLSLFPQLAAIQLPTLLVGLLALLALWTARQPMMRWLVASGIDKPRATTISRMAPLLVVLGATGLSVLTDAADEWGLAVVGSIPAGLPTPGLGFITGDGWLALLPSALLIALVGYVESISVARALAFRRREKLDPDQELLALGTTNLAGAIFGAMPVAGGFARSMVNFDAGARTQVASIVTALWVALGALLLTDLLYALPKAVLAAIIIMAVRQLIDFSSLRHTWHYDRGDGVAQGATILGVLVLGIEQGLLVGAALAAGFFLYRTSRPHIAVIGRVAGTEHYRNCRRRVVETWPQLLLVRVDENLYFANTPRVETELTNLVLERPQLRHVVLIFSGTAYVDASSLEMLETLEQSLAESGILLHLTEVKGPVMDRLLGTDLLQRLGSRRLHHSINDAVEQLLDPDAKARLTDLSE